MNEISSKTYALGKLSWREIGILYRRELRGALREKVVVVSSLLLPIFLFPFMLWAVFSGLMFMEGKADGLVARVAVKDWPKDHRRLRDQFERDDRLKLVAITGNPTNQLQTGELDAYLEFLPPRGKAASLPGNFSTRVLFDKSKERSAAAEKRITEIVDWYRSHWLQREAAQRGIETQQWRLFGLTSENLASHKEMGAFVMGLMLPILFVVMVAMGCFYPAVDTLAGERERNTWETLMSTAASRINVVTAKYLYVVTMGGLAGTLNVVTLVATMKPILAPLLGPGFPLDFSIPLGAIPILMLSVVLLAGFIAAVMLILASFARTFTDGQAVITPFYSVIPVPLIFLQIPGLQFSVTLAFLPIINITMMLRAALAGFYPPLPILITVIESVVLIAVCLRISGLILKFEDFVTGSYSGSIVRFFKERIYSKPRTPGSHSTS